MLVHLRLVRLRGDLSCVQKILVILAHFACWIPLGHPHDVDGRFKPHLCTLKGSEATSIHLFVDFLSKSCKPKYSLWKNGGYPEVRLVNPSLIGSQSPPCGHLLCSKNSSNACTIRILDPFGPSHEVEGCFKQCPNYAFKHASWTTTLVVHGHMHSVFYVLGGGWV